MSKPLATPSRALSRTFPECTLSVNPEPMPIRHPRRKTSFPWERFVALPLKSQTGRVVTMLHRLHTTPRRPRQEVHRARIRSPILMLWHSPRHCQKLQHHCPTERSLPWFRSPSQSAAQAYRPRKGTTSRPTRSLIFMLKRLQILALSTWTKHQLRKVQSQVPHQLRGCRARRRPRHGCHCRVRGHGKC